MNRPHSTNGLGTEVANDLWSPISGETQSLGANNGSQWQVTSNTPTNSSGSVTTYPNVGTYAYGGVVDDYTSLTTTYNLTMPIAGVGGTNTNSVAWATQDDWLSEPGNADGSFNYEVQVHLDVSDSTGGHDCAPTWTQGTWGIVATNVNIDGTLWHVCDGQTAKNSNGTCTNNGDCGEIVFILGGSDASLPHLTSTSGTVDLKAIFKWLETNDVPGQTYPFMEPGSALSARSQGWEIISTGGATQTFTNNAFTITATGAPSPPSSAPTGVSIAPGPGSTCVVSWNADASATAGYDLWSGLTGYVRSTPGTTSYTVTGTAGQSVSIEVAASNNGGNGPYSGFTNNCTIP